MRVALGGTLFLHSKTQSLIDNVRFDAIINIEKIKGVQWNGKI